MINDSVRRLDGYKVTLRVMERLSFGRLRPLCWLSNPCLRVRRRRGGSHTGSMGSTRLRKAASFNCRWDTNRTSPQCSSVPPSPKKASGRDSETRKENRRQQKVNPIKADLLTPGWPRQLLGGAPVGDSVRVWTPALSASKRAGASISFRRSYGCWKNGSPCLWGYLCDPIRAPQCAREVILAPRLTWSCSVYRHVNSQLMPQSSPRHRMSLRRATQPFASRCLTSWLSPSR